MLKRALFVLSAVALAGLVLFITLRAEPSNPSDPSRRTTTLRPLGDRPPPFDPNQNADRQRPVQAAREYRFVRINNRGQLIQVFGKEFRPLPQGVTEVEWPGARVHLTPHRVIEIRARKGTFVAPDSQPRSGSFQGRVVLTLFESSPDRRGPIDLTPNSPDLRLRLFMQDARFDLELGTIESQGDVHLTSPRFDFRGTGLTMSYNEGRARIEHMEIPQGKALRIKTASSGTPVRPAGSRGRAASQPASAPATRPATTPTFYVATFDHQVRVRGNDADVEADRLRLHFALTPGDGQEAIRGLGAAPWPAFGPSFSTSFAFSASSAPLLPGAPRAAASFVSQLLPAQPQPTMPAGPAGPPLPIKPATTAPASPQGADAPLPPDETMTPVGPDDVNITWAGPLTIEPSDTPPDELRGPDDVLIKLDGKPVRITTARKEVITASVLDYLSSNGRVRLLGVADYPVSITSRELGVLRCEHLNLDPLAGSGQIIGPGSLQAHPDARDAADADATRDGAGLPRDLAIVWRKSVNLAFYLRPARANAQAAGAGEFNRLRALKNVEFQGDVEVRHPLFDLVAQQLALALGDPERGRQSLDSISAKGQVRVAGRGDGEQGGIVVASEELLVEITRDARGALLPSALHARGGVKARHGAQRLSAGVLDVGLAVLPAAAPSASGPAASRPASPRPAVQTMQARENVLIEADDPAVRVMADRVDADIARDLFEIRGADGRPARLLRDDATLVGHLITLAPQAQRANVDGAGTFEFISVAPARTSATRPATTPTSAPTSAPAPTPSAVVTIAWKDSMRFDNRGGSALFVGGVESRARFGRDTTRLTSGQLLVEFASPPGPTSPAGGPNAAPATAPAAASANNPLISGARAVRAVTARNDVRFLAQSWLDDEQKNLASRLTLDGPVITFDNLAEQVQVVGPGHMLVEDYRPDARPSEAGKPQVRFTGRGATLFTWAGKLTLDAYHNDMLLDQQVQMLHRPADGQQPVQLDCRRFTADLESSGGLGVWLSGKSPQPTVKTISADQDVRVLSGGRTIRTDRLEYAGSTQVVTLRAEPGRLSELIDPEQPAPFTAQEFAWDLKSGQIVVDQPGAGRVPLGR